MTVLAQTDAPTAPGRATPVAWLVAGACAALVLFVAAIAYQPELSAGQGKGADALSRSPVGYAAVVELLRADGADVRLSRLPDAKAPLPDDALVVLTPTAATPPAEIQAVAKRRRVLLVPAKWVGVPDPRAPGRLVRGGELPPTVARDQAQAVLSQGPNDGAVDLRWEAADRPLALSEPRGEHDLGFGAARLRPVSHLRSLEGSAAQPVLVNGEGRAVLAIGRFPIDYVLADPDLLNNQGVADLAGARAAVRLLEGIADGGPIVFDLTLAGVAGQRSLARLLFEPPFAPATLSALLLAILVGLSARSSFGAVRRAPRAYAFGKRALADSAASLLALAGREPRLAGRYAEIVRAEAAAAVGLSPTAGAETQDATLDRIGRERGVEGWAEIAEQAAGVKTRAQLLAWARRAGAWRTEMTRGRG